MKILLSFLRIALIIFVSVVVNASCEPESYTGKIIISGSEPNLKFILVTKDVKYEIIGGDPDKLFVNQGVEVSLKGIIERESLGPGFPAILRVQGSAIRILDESEV